MSTDSRDWLIKLYFEEQSVGLNLVCNPSKCSCGMIFCFFLTDVCQEDISALGFLHQMLTDSCFWTLLWVWWTLLQVIYCASVGDATYKWLTMKICEVEKLIQSATGDECNSDGITTETFSAVWSLPQATRYGLECPWVLWRTVNVAVTDHWAALILLNKNNKLTNLD